MRLASDAFDRTLAACGLNPGLFSSTGDGTRMREGLRQFHLGTVLPIAKMIEAELRAKLETDISLRFDLYATDLAGRAQAFAKLVAGGMELDRAAAVSGILSGDAVAAWREYVPYRDSRRNLAVRHDGHRVGTIWRTRNGGWRYRSTRLLGPRWRPTRW